MKYKAAKDIPKFAKKYKTVVPSKLASFISMELNRKVSSESVHVWLKRHPEVQKKLVEKADKRLVNDSTLNQKVLAELCVGNVIDLEITDLDTLNLAKKYLQIIEDDLKTKICKKSNLKIIKRNKSI